ncbi:hypothetical protein ACFU90_14645 [Streptomyces noursei]
MSVLADGPDRTSWTQLLDAVRLGPAGDAAASPPTSCGPWSSA